MAKINKNDPLGFGISMFKDMSSNIRSSSGVERVREAIVGRLVDQLWYAPDYGVQIVREIRRSNPLQYPLLEKKIEKELLKDDRIATAEVFVNYDKNINVVKIIINARTTTNESINLVGSINNLSSGNIIFG